MSMSSRHGHLLAFFKCTAVKNLTRWGRKYCAWTPIGVTHSILLVEIIILLISGVVLFADEMMKSKSRSHHPHPPFPLIEVLHKGVH